MAQAETGKLTSPEAGQAGATTHAGDRLRFDGWLAPAVWLPTLAALSAILLPHAFAPACLVAAVLAGIAIRPGLAGGRTDGGAAADPNLGDEARYRLLADNAVDMIAHLDLAGRRLFVSQGSRDLLGYEPGDLVHTSMHETVHPEDAPGLRSVFASFAAGRMDRVVNVNRLRHRTGHWVWVEASLRLLRDPDGEPAGVVGVLRDITVRRVADDALRRSEERYRLLADNASDMIIHTDLAGRRLFVSPGSRDLSGYEPDELVGRSRSGFIHPEDEPDLQRKVDGMVEGRCTLVTHASRVRHKDGRWIWIEARVRLLRNAAGRPAGLVAALRDITHLKLVDQALRRSEERYRLLADNTTDLITLESTFSGTRSYVSPSVHAITGHSAAEFLGLPAADLIHPDDEPQAAAVFAALSPERPDGRSLHRVRHRAGHWLWMDTDFRLIEDDGGDHTVLVRSRDVSVRHEAELALAASEARYRALAESTSDVITQLDLHFRRRYVSPSCRRVLGFEPEEMLDVMPSTRMHPDDVVEIRTLATRLISGRVAGDQAICTYRSLHKDGHWVWLETLLTLVRDDGGAATSLICSLRDVTERQRVSRHLERAKVAAEAAARAKAEFIANMSHELRTPLTGIIGVHDLLRSDPGLTDAQRRMTDLASEAGRSLLAIVNDVLDFSKVEAGQLVLESMAFDADKLLADCCDLVRGQMGGKAVTVTLRRNPARLGWLQGDPTRIRQILLNLLTNAAKFTAQGSIDLEASYQAGTGLRVSVSDTGIGISADQAATLFDRFTQADTSTTRRYGGTGLGLAICKRLTELMGGRIGADMRAGGGSIFSFRLPLARSADRQAGPETRMEAAGRRTGLRLLLAEDNALNAEIVTAMLAGRGYEVAVVADGVAAVAATRSGAAPFDLILMDLQMPVMDGLSASLAIRSSERQAGSPRIPIVGLTANALAGDVDLCREAGMDAHVAKPIDWTKLFVVLDGLLPDKPAPLVRPSVLDPARP